MTTELNSESTLSQEANKRTVSSRITLEHVSYLLILVLAAILRFTDLSAVPLSVAEATEALAVWSNLGSQATGTIGVSPIYQTLTSFVAQFVVLGDSTVRIAPAFFGLALILLPWFLRDYCGRLGAITLAFFFAVSPLLTFASRQAGGISIAIFSGFLLIISWLGYARTSNSRWYYVVAIALAMGIGSDTVFYSFLLSIFLAYTILAFLRPKNLRGLETMMPDRFVPEAAAFRTSVIVFLSVLVLGSTAFFTNLSGIGSASELLVDWLGSLIGPSSSYWSGSILDLFSVFGFTAIVLLLAAVTWLIRRKQAFLTLTLYWMVVALIMLIVGQNILENLIIFSVPAYILIATMVDRVFEPRMSSKAWLLIIFITGMGALIYVNWSRFTRIANVQGPGVAVYYMFIVLLTLVIGAIILAFIWSVDENLAKQGVVGGLIVLTIVNTWSSMWWLTREALLDTRLIFFDSAPDDDLPHLVDTIREVSWRLTGTEDAVQIHSTEDGPLLRWYLRDMPEVEFGAVLAGSEDIPVLLTREGDDPPLQNNYMGTDLGYRRTNTHLEQNFLQDLRWYFYHESPIRVSEEKLVIWVRSDLIEENQ